MSAASAPATTRLIGVGSEWGGDDAAGLAVVRALAGRLPPQVGSEELRGDPTTLLERWQGAELVVLVDAVRGCGPPGSVHCFDASREPIPAGAGTTTHSFNFAETIELGRQLGTLPRRIVAIGIEGSDFTVGHGLSPEVESAIGPAAELALGELVGPAVAREAG